MTGIANGVAIPPELGRDVGVGGIFERLTQPRANCIFPIFWGGTETSEVFVVQISEVCPSFLR